MSDLELVREIKRIEEETDNELVEEIRQVEDEQLITQIRKGGKK